MCLRDVTADIALAVAPNVTPDVSLDVAPMDRGRDGALVCAAPASEPDWRISTDTALQSAVLPHED